MNNYFARNRLTSLPSEMALLRNLQYLCRYLCTYQIVCTSMNIIEGGYINNCVLLKNLYTPLRGAQIFLYCTIFLSTIFQDDIFKQVIFLNGVHTGAPQRDIIHPLLQFPPLSLLSPSFPSSLPFSSSSIFSKIFEKMNSSILHGIHHQSEQFISKVFLIG